MPLLYAEDLKLFRRVAAQADCIHLQSDLDVIADRFQSHGLVLNINKCRVLTFINKKNILRYKYKIGDNIITRKDKVRDLGITFDSKLNFSCHIDSITSAAYRLLGFVVRNSGEFCNLGTWLTLYNAIIRRKLEYASVVWVPHAQVTGIFLNLASK
jgi:hypothetical protein